VSSHVVFAVELLGANCARIRLPVQMGCDVMPMKVGGVSVGVVAHFAPVGVALLDTVTPDADGGGVTVPHAASSSSPT